MTQGDSESQFRLPVPATGTRGQHTCGVKARLIITTPLQTGLRCRGKGETPTLGLQPGPEGLKSFGQTRPVALLSTYFRPCPLPAPWHRSHASAPRCYRCPRAEREPTSKHLPVQQCPSTGFCCFPPLCRLHPPAAGAKLSQAQHGHGQDFRRCLMSSWQRT